MPPEVTLEVENIYTYVSGEYSSKTIDAVTRFHPEGYQFQSAFKAHRWDGYTHLYRSGSQSFPTGLLRRVKKALLADGLKVRVKDCREIPDTWTGKLFPLALHGITLRDPQVEAIDRMITRQRGIMKATVGFGKCLGLGTPVIKYDGSVVPVEEIRDGDLLMGPDSRPRAVSSTVRGAGPLFRITPRKGKPWVCNENHVLTLAHTSKNTTIDVPLQEYLAWPAYIRADLKQFGTGVVFPAADPLPLDPYFLGVWYGDGRKDLKQGICVTKPGPEIRQVMQDTADAFGLELRSDVYGDKCVTHRIVGAGWRTNSLLDLMREVVGAAEHIPTSYLTASEHDRRAFLAGILDTDGHLVTSGYEIAQKRRGIADGIAFIARSLGMRVSMKAKVVNKQTYWRMHIWGECSALPMRIPRKQAPERKANSVPTRTGFEVTSIGHGEYAGFTLDGDGRFLLGDFTVTHNTEAMAGIMQRTQLAGIVMVPSKSLLHQTADRLEERLGQRIGRIGDGIMQPQFWTVATLQTLAGYFRKPKPPEPEKPGGKVTPEQTAEYQAVLAEWKERRAGMIHTLSPFKLLLLDEAHHNSTALDWNIVLEHVPAFMRIGVSGTPFKDPPGVELRLIGATGEMEFNYEATDGIADGIVVQPYCYFIAAPEGLTAFGTQPAYTILYDDEIVNNTGRNELIVNVARQAAVANKLPTVVIVERIEHGEILAEALGWEFVSGSWTQAQRDKALKDVNSGEKPGVVSTVISEGIDLPNIACLVLASAGKARHTILQRVGRGMRVGVTPFVLVFDFDDQQKVFKRHSSARRVALKKAGFPVERLARVPQVSELVKLLFMRHSEQ